MRPKIIFIGFAVLFLTVSIVAVSIIIGINDKVTSSEPFKVAMTYISDHGKLNEYIGKVEGHGFGISSKVTTNYKNGVGKAEYKIPVKGSSRDAMVRIELKLDSANTWRVINMSFK